MKRSLYAYGTTIRVWYRKTYHTRMVCFSVTSISTCFRSHDREKRRAYEQRVREVERGSFTPLIFSALGGISRATEITYKRLASLLATKKDEHYNAVISLIRCRLNFSLLRSAIMCIRGSRSAAGHPRRDFDFALAISESRLPLTG